MNRIRAADAVGALLDFIMVLLVVPAALILKCARRIGLQRLRLSRTVLTRIGVLPVRRHYYEPFVVPTDLKHPLHEERQLPGIDWNLSGQLAFLSTLTYEREFAALLLPQPQNAPAFHFGNGSFESGDAEYLYQIIRRMEPKRVIEVGAGQSTIIVQAAIKRNLAASDGYTCEHVCIEPYEAPWLEAMGVQVIRRRVEDVDRELFNTLNRGDLLFVDSSHVIRPQGDVVTEYLEILPTLRSGVIVHLHDIFSPRDYLREWVFDMQLLWNEQYLLEGFLTNNCEWTVLGALNLLKHRHFDALQRACPYLISTREPASFYIQKN